MKRFIIISSLMIIIFFVIMQLLQTSVFAQGEAIETKVVDILSNPGSVSNDAVIITGIVEQYVPGTSTTNSYLLKGEYGGIIKVNTFLPKPRLDEMYRVTGIVYIDPQTRDPFISEQSRIWISKAGIRDTSGVGGWVKGEQSMAEWKKYYTAMIVVVLALIVIIIYALLRNRLGLNIKEEMSVSEEGPEIREDLKTIRIYSAPKTMKFIPGELVITSGRDKGKTFKIAGYPTQEGIKVTIGREKVTGDRAYAHIMLGEEYKTVSRKQAELISRNGKLYIKNLSGTNYTQVDGIELGPGEIGEVRNGSIIKMGELEMEYRI